jgi:hypothetical protein
MAGTPQNSPQTYPNSLYPQNPVAGGKTDPYPNPTYTGYFPEPNTSAALQQGSVIRFFEETFEWENMQYVFYPYYWGRKSYWYDRVLQEDPDPNFAEFLRAGAARVVVTVTPGWEGVVNYYLNTCQVWNGGDLPNVTTPGYYDIATEIQAMEDAPTIDNPTPIQPPWQFKLPTTMIYLRSDGLLPYWYQDPTTGAWTPGTYMQDANGNTIPVWTEDPTTGVWNQYQAPVQG